MLTVRQSWRLPTTALVSDPLPPIEPANLVSTSMRVPQKILAQIDELAAERGYSRSAAMLELIKAGLEQIQPLRSKIKK